MLDSFIFRMVVKGGHAKKDFWCGQIIVIENSKLGHPTPASRAVLCKAPHQQPD